MSATKSFSIGGILLATFITKLQHGGKSSIKRREQALLFLRKAAQDEALLGAVLESSQVSDEVIGFHCQQAAEKLLKALLFDLGAAFHKTHDLGALMDTLARSGAPLPSEFDKLESLTPFGVFYRYDDYDGTNSLNRTETRAIEVTPLIRGGPPAKPDHFDRDLNLTDASLRYSLR